MSNQNNPGGSRNGFQQAGGSRQQNERLNPIEEVMDAFKNIALTAGSGAILAPNWQSASLVDSGQEPLKGPGNERNQIPIDRSKGSSGESKNKGVATENGGWDKNHRVDPFDEERNNQAHKNYYSNFGNSYMDLGDATDPTTGTHGHNANISKLVDSQHSQHHHFDYSQQNTWDHTSEFKGNHNFGCQTIGSRPFEGTRTPPPPPQQREQRSDSKNEQNSNFRHEQTSDSKHDQGSTMSQSLNIQSHTSQSQTESVHDHQPIVLSTDSITFKINAWHSIADPNAAERDDGIGTGQLHRKGRNYRPVDEATVLAIQQKGKSSTKKPKKLFEDNSTPLPSSSNNKPIQKSLSRSKPLSKPGPHKLPNNPFATNTFTSPSSSTSPASSAPQRPYPVKQDARTTINQQQQREKTSSPLPPPLQQQPQSSQTPSQGPEKENWTSPNLVTTPFWEIPQNNNSQSAAKSTHYQQSQSYRHPSPARSPRPSKYSQDFLPYIPPEFDSTPYRKQSSPSPARGYSPARGHSPARSYSNGYIDEPPEYERESNFDDQEDYDQNSDVDDETNVYYEEDESFSEKEGYESASVLFDDEPISRPLPPPLVPTPVSPKHDRGHHLLTINVELSESEPPQAIVVYVNDDPAVLAREFCNKWKVTNDVVEPALVQLIREEREKRLG